jgi:uncharacterized membrane protein
MAKPYGLAFTAAIVGLLIGAAGGSPLIYAAAGFALVVALTNQRKIDNLSNQLAELRGDSPQPESETQPQSRTPASSRGTGTDWGAARATTEDIAGGSETDRTATQPGATADAQPGVTADTDTSKRSAPASGSPPKWLTNLGNLAKAVVGWFTGGNIFMRVGIVLLFLGIGFLISYASGLGIISVEMRMTAIALSAVAGLIVGQRLLASRRDYALMLQGAAIGVLYLDIFGAFSLYELIPAAFAFALLFAVSALAATLAVLQNAAPLAYAGFAGGFLAPILASSGSGNYVGLFSYYVVLNITLLAIAWFKSWRPLNLLGFYFTFGVAALWGLDSYSSDKYASTQPFLIIFFLIYACIPILYARRQPINLRGYVDGSLLFGTAIISFGMQLVLVEHFEYGAAWSALGFGAFYVVTASMLWRRREEEQLLLEVFLALGVVFATLVIPFALGASDTAGVWALEGAGLIWIGLRQDRPLARAAGIALQLAAAIFWLSHQPSAAAAMFVNSSYLSGIMLAAAGFFSARLYRSAPTKPEAACEQLFIVWFVLWWFGIGCREIILFIDNDLIGNWFVGYAALSAVAITVLCRRWTWPRMQSTALLVVGLYALAGFHHVVDTEGPLHEFGGWLVWPVGMLAYYWILSKSESSLSELLLAAGHVAMGLLLLGVLYVEILWFGEEWLDLHRTWVFAMVAALNIAALQLIHRARFWPIVDWPNSYVGWIGSVVGFSLALMILASFENSGTAPPLPWLPVLNPLDAIALIGVLSLITHWLDLGKLYPLMSHQNNTRIAWVCLGLATFVWLNVTLFRTLHHWWGLIYDLDAMLASSVAQTSLTILWVIVGMLVVIVASRREMRNFWLAGGALLVIVVAKLFLEDLANTGSLERIVSFLGVGAVLILIGYFSPIPPKAAEQK